MTLYLIVLLYIPLVLLAICSKKDELVLKVIFLLIYLVIVLLHFDAGPDHRIYKWVYGEPLFSVPFEPLYMFVMGIFKGVGFDYVEFLYAYRLLNFVLFSYFVFKIDRAKLVYFMGMYIPISFVTFEFNLLRQVLSLHLGLIAVSLFLEGKNKFSYLFMFFAVISHASAILMFLLYFQKITPKILVSVVVFTLFFAANAVFIGNKFNDYQELGAISFRFDASILQMVVLLIMPFLFFKTESKVIPVIVYSLLCLSTLMPVLVRLYPIALLILLPNVISMRAKPHQIVMLIFLVVSIIMAIGKTNLLLQIDRQSIAEGVYAHGYVE